MSAPKTIHLSPVHAKQLEETSEMRAGNEIEYRLVDPNEQSKIQLTGEYHADCNALINVLSNVRSNIERIKAEILSNEGYFIDDGEGTYGNFHSEESIIKIIDRISNENDVPVIGGDS